MYLPQSRTNDIIVQTIGDEWLIYDLSCHKAYCLNETSSFVYGHCNGETTMEQLKSKDGRLSDDVVYVALDQLRSRDLLVMDGEAGFKGMSRRDVVKRVGLASMIAMPLISSLVAPLQSHAQSVGVTCVPGGFIPDGSQVSFPGLTCGVSCNSCPCALNNCNPLCCSGMAIAALDNSSMTLCIC